VRAFARAARTLALLSVGATSVLAYALLRNGVGSWGEGVLDAVVLALLVAPAAVLASFWIVLREAAALPDRIAVMPATARRHAEGLAGLLEEATGGNRRGWRRVLLVRRLRSQIQASRELVTPWAPILPLLSLPYLGAVLVAALGAVAEAVTALVVALAL